MAETLSIRSLSPYQKITPEIEKEEEAKKRNILFLLLILIGVNGSDLLEQGVKSAASKVEALKGKLEGKQELIEKLNNRLKEICNLFDELSETGKKLEELTEFEKQEYFAKSTKLQNIIEAAQLDVKLQMKNANVVMQEIVKSAKIDIEPLKQIVEALQSMGSKLSDLFNSQWGNNINFRR